MFNNYKKNKPKNLPKYDRGGEGRASVDNTRTMYGGSEDASTGSSIGNTESGTQNIYNEKRGSNISAGQINQYAQMGQAVAQGGMQAYQTSQTPGLSEYEKNQQYGESIKSAEQGVVSAINPIFGMIHSGVTAATAPLTAKATQTDEQGNLKNKNFAKADIIGQGFADPMAMIPTMISNKFSMKKYINSVEDNAKGKIAAQKAQEDAYAQQQAAYQQQQNDYINNAIQAGMASYQNQPQGTSIKYPHGGMNNIPNAIPQYPNGGTMPRLKPRNFAAEKANYEEATRGANQGDGSGISSAELAYKYSKLIDPTGATSAVEIGKNFYTGNPQDPIDYLGLVRVPFVSQGMKPLSKLAKQGNKASVLINTITKTNDVAESFRAGGMMGDKYANGGAVPREFANSEVEKEENTLNPDGTTTQFDGPSHEQGGIPTQLDPGTLIFSDKLKHGGKTFAHLNKANLTHKEDKILNDPNSSNTLKQTAQLMKDTKMKNSISLFKIQEEMKQSKLDKYTKRLGGIQKYPYGGELTTDLNAQQDPRFYNYQGSKMMAPNLKALGKDSGVAPDINLNNYNTLLNTRTQVRDSNVQMGKQLPKFEYINDPTKGDYNTQFENYKKVNVGYFKNGGMLPKYPEGDMFGYRPTNNIDKMKIQQAMLNSQSSQAPSSSWITSEMLQNNSGNVERTAPQVPVQKDTTDYSNYNQQTYDQELARMNASGGNGNGDKSNWFNRNSDSLYQAGFGLAQNAGQLAYLAEQGKKYDTQQFYSYNPDLLNDSAAMRDANEQTRRAEYNVRGASAGNAGTYLSNRVALNAQNIENKDRIRQQYANANAGIKNRANEVNLANKYSVDDINAKNKGAALNQYYKAIGSIGVNTAQGLKDNKNRQTDEKTIGMFTELYNNPEFQKFMKEQEK